MSRASGLKAVAVVFTRLLNSPATLSDFPSVVVEVFKPTQNDSMDNQQPPASPEHPSFGERGMRAAPLSPIHQPSSAKQDAWQAGQQHFYRLMCNRAVWILITVAILFLVARPLLYLAGFLGAWFAVAQFGRRMKQSEVVSGGGGFIVALFALTGLILLGRWIDGTGVDGNGTRDSDITKTSLSPTRTMQTIPGKDLVLPMFKSEAEIELKHLTAQAEKVERLMSLLQQEKPISLEEYAELETSGEIRRDTQFNENAVRKRIAEIELAHKGGNGYFRVVAEDVPRGYGEMLFVITKLEDFVRGKPEDRIQAARACVLHHTMMMRAVQDAKTHFSDTSSKADSSRQERVETVKREEFEGWLNQARRQVEKLDALWKQFDQSQPSKTDVKHQLAALCQQGQTLQENYRKWVQTVDDRAANITDPQQMDSYGQPHELWSKMTTLFCWFHDQESPEYIWEDRTNLQDSQGHEIRIMNVNFMVEAVKDAEQELANWNQ